MAQDLKVGLKITADGKQAVGEVDRVVDAIDQMDGTVPGVDRVGESINQMGNAAQSADEKTSSLVAGLKTLAGAAVVREFIQANATIESIGASLEAVTGNAESAALEMAYIRNESMRLGIETASAAQSFLTLAAATKGTNLEGQATRDIWSAVAGKMSQLGASSADIAGAMTQLAQGASKGKFELEDIKSIAERIPGFFSTFAGAIGVTTEQFSGMVSQGEITSAMLPKLAAAMGGARGEINTFNANLGRLKNAFTDAAITLGDTGIFQALSTATRGAAFGVTLLVSEFVLLGKTLGNIAFSVATLDFSGFLNRQKALIDDTRKSLDKAEKQILGTGEAAKEAGTAAQTGFKAAADAAADLAKETEAAKAKAKALEDALKASLAAREKIEADFAARRNKINAPQTEDAASFDRLNLLQSRARELAVRAGQTTGKDAKRLADEALATANKAADVVQQLNDGGQATDFVATGLLNEVERIAQQAAEGLKNVGITVDANQALEQARTYHAVWQQFLNDNPLTVVVKPVPGAGDSPGGLDVSAALRAAALQSGGRR